jgi:hypothetical protein
MYDPSGSIAMSWMDASASGIWKIKTTAKIKNLQKILNVSKHAYHKDTANTFTSFCKVGYESKQPITQKNVRKTPCLIISKKFLLF